MKTWRVSNLGTSELVPLSGYRLDVQAMRAIAVLAVVLYHTGKLLPGGYVGVDMFFVVSGFVIGRVLVQELHTTGSISFRTFYSRRGRRILPALCATLTIVVLLAPILAPLGAQAVTSRTAVAASLFNANTYLFRVADVGYFGAATELNPLLHTWSLSVEEQFYFFVPAIMALAWRLRAREVNRVLVVRQMVAGVLTISLIICLVASYSSPFGTFDVQFAFFSPITRAWQFAVGLGIVVLPQGWTKGTNARRLLLPLGGALLVLAILCFDDETLFPGLAAAVPTIGAALVIFGGTSPSTRRPGRLYSTLIGVGDVSYSWYLWHWPLIVFAGAFWPKSGVLPLIGAAVVSFPISKLSYHHLENRVRQASLLGWRTPVMVLGCIVLPILAVASSVPIAGYIKSQPPVQNLILARQLHADVYHGCDSATPLSERPEALCTWSKVGFAKSAVLIGDSNAGQFSEPMISAATQNRLDLRIATMSGCRFLELEQRTGVESAQCDAFVEGSMEELVRRPPDLVVIANSSDNLSGLDRRSYEEGLAGTLIRLTDAGAEVAVINVIPKPNVWDPGECGALTLLLDTGECGFDSFRLEDSTATLTAREIENRAAKQGGAHTWDYSQTLCPGGKCEPLRSGSYLWRDRDHLSIAGSRLLESAMGEDMGLSVN